MSLESISIFLHEMWYIFSILTHKHYFCIQTKYGCIGSVLCNLVTYQKLREGNLCPCSQALLTVLILEGNPTVQDGVQMLQYLHVANMCSIILDFVIFLKY